MRRAFAKRLLDIIYYATNQNVWEVLDQIEPLQRLDRHSLETLQTRRLRDVVSFAYHNVPYYRRAWESIGIRPDDIRSLGDIRELPILERESVRTHQALLKDTIKKTRTFVRKTSGSTGEPIAFEKDVRTLAVMDAVMYRSYMWHGIRPGDRQLRIWCSAVDPLGRLKLSVKDFLTNRIRLSAFCLDRDSYLQFIGKAREFKPTYLYGYSQSVFEFAQFMLDERIDARDLRIRAAIVTAEMLFDWQREVIQEAFGCPVVNEYGSSEVGIIAFECSMGTMHIMADTVLVECLKETGLEGTEHESDDTGELIVTELSNFYSPLIRYRLGDRGVLSASMCGCGCSFPAIAALKGRSGQFIAFPNGKKADAYVFEHILRRVTGTYGTIRQFGVAQDSTLTVFLKIAADTSHPDKMERAITEAWYNLYSKEVPLKVVFVKGLPRKPSGKLAYFENL